MTCVCAHKRVRGGASDSLINKMGADLCSSAGVEFLLFINIIQICYPTTASKASEPSAPTHVASCMFHMFHTTAFLPSVLLQDSAFTVQRPASLAIVCHSAPLRHDNLDSCFSKRSTRDHPFDPTAHKSKKSLQSVSFR